MLEQEIERIKLTIKFNRIMSVEQGNLSVNTENIFPIIKKFLYSDHEIFLRELVANAVDATQKLKHLSSSADFDKEATSPVGDLKVKVSFDKEAKTITVSDNGIGMTAEDIKKYINQIAFSGAAEFVEKYKVNPFWSWVISIVYIFLITLISYTIMYLIFGFGGGMIIRN